MVCSPPYNVTITLTMAYIHAVCIARYTNREGREKTYEFSSTVGYSSVEDFYFMGFEASKEDGETENEFADIDAFNAFIMAEGAPRFGPGTFVVRGFNDALLSPGCDSSWRAAHIVDARLAGGEPYAGTRWHAGDRGDDFDIVHPITGAAIATPLRYSGSQNHITRTDIKNIWVRCVTDYFAAGTTAE
jgi:hypothetical protein